MTTRLGWHAEGVPDRRKTDVGGTAPQLRDDAVYLASYLLMHRARVHAMTVLGLGSQTRASHRWDASTRRIKVSKRGVIGIIMGLGLVAMLAVGCGTLTGAAVGAGSGAAIGAATGNTKKGALIGTGVGAAGGAIYDATR